MRSESQRTANGEVYWKYSRIREALTDIAAARRVILGFDIVEFVNGAGRIWGSSDHSRDGDVRPGSWDDRVERGLQLSLRDVDHIRDLTGLEPPYDNLWFTVADIESGEGRDGNR
jgi:hypothetical protein